MHKGFADLSLTTWVRRPITVVAYYNQKEGGNLPGETKNGFPWRRVTFFSKSQGKSSDSDSHRRTRYLEYMPVEKGKQDDKGKS